MAGRFRAIGEGDRWRCIRCGSCCSNGFEEGWIGSFIPEYSEEVCRGYCPNVAEFNGVNVCLRYRSRPQACRAFPFTLRRNGDGRYALVIHVGCRGFGSGKAVNVRSKIRHVVRCAGKAYNKRFKVRFQADPRDNTVSVEG